MPETDESNSCSAVCVLMRLRFCLCLTRYFYVRSVLIFSSTLLICTSWAEFITFNPVFYYCIALIACLMITFCEKGHCDKKKSNAREEAKERKKEQREQQLRIQRRAAQQVLQEEQRASQQACQEQRAVRQAFQQEQMAIYQARYDEQIAAQQARLQVPIHRPNVPSDGSGPSPGEHEPPNMPLQPVENSARNVPQSIAGPSTQFPHNMPMDVGNKEAQNVVPSQPTEPSVLGSNFPQSSSDLSIQSTRSEPLDHTSEGTRSDNLPQSSTDLSSPSTSSASAHRERRFDESLQAMPPDSSSNVPQSSRDSSS